MGQRPEQRSAWFGEELAPCSTRGPPARDGAQTKPHRNVPASGFEIAGGNIRNIALAAAFLAAEDRAVATMGHVIRATRREFQKMGKVIRDGEFEAKASVR